MVTYVNGGQIGEQNYLWHTQDNNHEIINIHSVPQEKMGIRTCWWLIDVFILHCQKKTLDISKVSVTEYKKGKEPRNQVPRKASISEEGLKGFPA